MFPLRSSFHGAILCIKRWFKPTSGVDFQTRTKGAEHPLACPLTLVWVHPDSWMALGQSRGVNAHSVRPDQGCFPGPPSQARHLQHSHGLCCSHRRCMHLGSRKSVLRAFSLGLPDAQAGLSTPSCPPPPSSLTHCSCLYCFSMAPELA